MEYFRMAHLSIFLMFLAFSGYFQRVHGLLCLTCEADSIEECDRTGELKLCLRNEKSCESVVRRKGYTSSPQYRVFKGCKQTKACINNQIQNPRPSGASTQCNTDQPVSVCTCCCKGDTCNIGNMTCLEPTTTLNNCSIQIPPPRVDLACSDSNRVDSVCQFECTDPAFTVHPHGHEVNICLRNGTWNQPQPCCARSCPPYLVKDAVFIYHASNSFNWFLMLEFITSFNMEVTLGADGFRFSSLYFSGDIHENTIIKFADYGDNRTTLNTLIYRNFGSSEPPNTADGQVNIGAALTYARTHLLREEAGARDTDTRKLVIVLTDANSSDDVTGPAEALRNDNVMTYVLFHNRAGFFMDLNQMLSIAGAEQHLFVTSDNSGPIEIIRDEILGYFCIDPC